MDDAPTIRDGSSGTSPEEGPVAIPAHRLLRAIGEGSYGRIWLAINAMGTYRAVKVVNRSRFKEDRPYEREYEGIKNFEPLSRAHEGFVDILQVERNDQAGYFYSVMELADDTVRGQAIEPDTYVAATLSKKTAEHGRIPLKDCLAIGITLAGTLDFLHKNKLVHRDIKSENIVLINGRPKLADIGLVTDIRSDSTYVGTPGFIPPEGPGAPAADIYSLGKVLYEISTGLDRKEFPRTPANSLVDEPDGAFPEWDAIVRKASDDNVMRRYQSAAELQAHLALVRAGKSVRRLLQFERSIALAKRIGPIAAAILIMVAAALFQAGQMRKRAAEDRQRQAGAAVASGSIRMADGDYLGALPPFLRALEIDAGDPVKERTHRVRIASLLRHSPALIHVSYRSNHIGPAVFGATSDEMLSTRADGRFAVWDIRDNRAKSPLFGGTGYRAERGVFDPGFRHVVTSFGSNNATVWDARTGEQLQSIQALGWVLDARFNRDGTRIVYTTHEISTATVWDVAKGGIEFALNTPTNFLWHADFSPDGRRVAAGSTHGPVFIWDLATPDRPRMVFTNHQYWVYDIAFSPDSRLLATASGDHSSRVVNIETGHEVLPPLEHNDHVYSVVFSPDGRWLLTACLEGTAHVWDVRTGRHAFPIIYHPGRIRFAAFSPDGSRILTTSYDGTLCVWELRPLNPVAAPALIAFSADGRRSATLTNRSIELRHTSDSSLMARVPSENVSMEDLSLSADGSTLLCVAAAREKSGQEQREVQLWDLSTGPVRGPRFSCSPGLTNLALAPDGHRLAAFGGSNVVVWNTANGERVGAFSVEPRPKSRPIERVVFNRSGQRAALFCKGSKFAELWDLNAKQPRLITAISNIIQVSHVEFSPNDLLFLVATSDSDLNPGLAQVFDAETGAPAGPPLNHSDGVRHATFSPDSERVLTSAEDFTAVLWEARTGARISVEPMQHKEWVRHGAFSHDGRWLVTTEKNGVVRLWDVFTGGLLSPPMSHPSWIYSAQFVANGRQLATRSRNGEVFLWDLPEDTRPLEDLRLIAQVVSGQHTDGAGKDPAQAPDALRRNWEKLRTRYPAEFSPGK